MRKKIVTPLLALGLVLALATFAFGAFLGGPIGDQPTVTPQLRVRMPAAIRAGAPIPVAVAYRNFDFEPQLRCAPAGPCTGTLPQTVINGRDVGHIHVYLQRVTGGFADAASDSFCIPATATGGRYDGTVTGTCPAVTPGRYRVAAEFQSNSHVSALKAENHPQDMPTSDIVYTVAR